LSKKLSMQMYNELFNLTGSIDKKACRSIETAGFSSN